MGHLYSDILVELHVPDFKKVKDFYGSIGYEVVWERKPDLNKGYLVLINGKSILNFYCGNNEVYNHDYFKRFPKDTPRGYGVELVIPVDDIVATYELFKKRCPDSIVNELSHEHSHKDFRAKDPYDYYLRFVERYNWIEDRDKQGNSI